MPIPCSILLLVVPHWLAIGDATQHADKLGGHVCIFLFLYGIVLLGIYAVEQCRRYITLTSRVDWPTVDCDNHFYNSALNKVEVSSYANEKRNNKYLSYNYEKFHEKYDSIIKPAFNNGFYEALVYSIMIHENFNRPPVVRWIEYARMHLTKRRHTLGIMQVKSDKIIDDATSIGIAIDMIIEINNKLYEEHKEHSFYSLGSFALMIAHKYNPGDHLYSSAVRDIYEYIAEKYYEDVPSKFEKLNRNSTEQPNEELKK